jgi:hypothetical protein
MVRIIRLYGLMSAMLVVVAVLFAVPVRAADGKVSGVVVDTRPGRVILEEQGPWTGPGTGIVRHTIELTPRTVVRFVRPTGEWDDNATPGYDVSAADPGELRPGDFVTVMMGAPRQPAVSLDVMRADDAGGQALPRR